VQLQALSALRQTSWPGVAMYNMLIQLFANGATGFNMYIDDITYDMAKLAIWLAMRGAISQMLKCPFEDLIMDGVPVADGAITVCIGASRRGRQRHIRTRNAHDPPCVVDDSVPPYGCDKFQSHIELCERKLEIMRPHNECIILSQPTCGVMWSNKAEHGSVLLFGARTLCHIS
jgi:hypothetical protein